MTQARLFLAGMVILLIAIAGNAYFALGNYNSVRAANHRLASDQQGIARQNRTIKGLAQRTAALSRQNAKNLANYKASIAARRAQTKRTLAQLARENAANRKLTQQVGSLAAQRNADNAAAISRASSLVTANRREVAALAQAQTRIAQAQTRITSLEASQHHASLQAQYDTCVQVERVKSAVRFTLTTIFGASHLTPSQQQQLAGILAQFKPRVCVKP